ncbi:MAG: nuclear transport factor 2 family protein [Aphanocapsa sp. GSE-SYN-MK-11-07L]|nr:nuclear transport factor 2 family protein [Aphanocapsa sp. GSE-SYN-MK-11-07L]
MSPEVITSLVTAYFASLQTMDQEQWLQNFTEDALIYDPVGNPPSRAIADADKFFGLLSMAFATLQLTQDSVFVVKNGAAVKWTMQATGKNGKQATAEGISIFEIDESGKIQQVSSYWDDAALMAQLKD